MTSSGNISTIFCSREVFAVPHSVYFGHALVCNYRSSVNVVSL